jgi:hypoxanthine phosphoribosyltransferase
MKWIEIIEIRSTGDTLKQLEKHVQEIINQAEKKTGQLIIKLYSRMNIVIDLSIHMVHDSSVAKSRGSSLGIRLVSTLKSYGLVNHTIWIEKQKDSLT